MKLKVNLVWKKKYENYKVCKPNPRSKRTSVKIGKSGMTGRKMIRKVIKTPF